MSSDDEITINALPLRLLFSQRLELMRVVRWLKSERFKCDESVSTMRSAAEEIAEMITGGVYVKDTEWMRSEDGAEFIKSFAKQE